MQVTLAALGGGTPDTLTAQVRAALKEAALVVGAPRLLQALPAGTTENRAAAVRPADIMERLQAADGPAVVVFSGDTGFYSGARLLLPLLEKAGLPARVLPGVSAVQLLAARLGRPWQDWALVSAHGAACDAVRAVCGGRPVCFLTGGPGSSPAALCARLTAAGLGGLGVTVGEDLSLPGERVTHLTAADAAAREFAPLSVLLAEPAPRAAARAPGWPDEDFIRGETPMTKRFVRAGALAALGVAPGDVAWDVGAGTGSVSVELAFANGGAPVFACECDAAACALVRRNREKFGAWNLTPIEGRAPAALAGLPAPDVVFVGGSKGALAQILDAALQKNPHARLCVPAVALETLSAALAAFAARGLAPQAVQLAVSTARGAGALHLLTANNPVFLVTGGGQ